MLLAAVLALAAPSLSSAARIGSNQVVSYDCTVSSVACTSLQMDTSKTFDAINVEGLDAIAVLLDYTYDSGTYVTMTCAGSDTSSGRYRDIQVLSYTGATAASDSHVWSQPVSGDEYWPWIVPVYIHKYMKCTLSVTGGTSSDLLDIDIYGVEY